MQIALQYLANESPLWGRFLPFLSDPPDNSILLARKTQSIPHNVCNKRRPLLQRSVISPSRRLRLALIFLGDHPTLTLMLSRYPLVRGIFHFFTMVLRGTFRTIRSLGLGLSFCASLFFFLLEPAIIFTPNYVRLLRARIFFGSLRTRSRFTFCKIKQG